MRHTGRRNRPPWRYCSVEAPAMADGVTPTIRRTRPQCVYTQTGEVRRRYWWSPVVRAYSTLPPARQLLYPLDRPRTVGVGKWREPARLGRTMRSDPKTRDAGTRGRPAHGAGKNAPGTGHRCGCGCDRVCTSSRTGAACEREPSSTARSAGGISGSGCPDRRTRSGRDGIGPVGSAGDSISGTPNCTQPACRHSRPELRLSWR